MSSLKDKLEKLLSKNPELELLNIMYKEKLKGNPIITINQVVSRKYEIQFQCGLCNHVHLSKHLDGVKYGIFRILPDEMQNHMISHFSMGKVYEC